MHIPLFTYRSLLTVAAFCPALLAAAPGITTLHLDDDLLAKINFETEWQAPHIPSQLNAASVINNLPEAQQMATRYDNMLRETFRQRLSAAFQDGGYTGSMKLIENATEADRGMPILVIDLTRWALSQKQRFDCHFSARLVTSWGEANLGTHEYSDAQLHDEYAKGRNVGVEKATDQAIAKFMDKLAADALLAPPAGRSPIKD